MSNEIKEILYVLKHIVIGRATRLTPREADKLLDYITNLQEELRIRDTNWQSLKYYLEKLYNKDYIEEEIFDDICKRVNELESQIEIKSYQKEITNLQEEIKSANESITWWNNRFNAVQEENKKLKNKLEDEKKNYKRITTYLQEENERLKKLKERYQLEKEDYKTRNEKAVEYIKIPIVYETNNIEDLEKTNRSRNEELLEILQGKSDE